MVYRVAINGFGRIVRNYLRATLERGAPGDFEVVAINDLWPAATLAHLLAHDSTFGPLRWPVHVDGSTLRVGGQQIALVLPELRGRLNGVAVRVPVENCSVTWGYTQRLVDLTTLMVGR